MNTERYRKHGEKWLIIGEKWKGGIVVRTVLLKGYKLQSSFSAVSTYFIMQVYIPHFVRNDKHFVKVR